MKRALLIALDFPPRRTSGVYRPSGMLKALSQSWSITVLTVEPHDGELLDTTLVDRIPPSVAVERTRWISLDGWERRVASVAQAAGAYRPDCASSVRGWQGFVRKFARLIRSVLYFPDHTAGWVPFALARAVVLHIRQHFDVIYTSSPPRSAPVVGLLLKKMFGIPWVSEFRDPWWAPKSAARAKFERWLQSLILSAADRIVTVTAGYAELIQEEFGVSASKLSILPNGFDEGEFASVDEEHPVPQGWVRTGVFNIAHFGTLYPGTTGEFFSAVRELIAERPELREQLRVSLVGFPEGASGDDLCSLDEVVKRYPFMDHQRAIQAIRSSDALLLFQSRTFSKLCIPGKAYEYMRCGRPIIALTFGGDLKTLIEESGAGLVVEPDDRAAIKRAIVAVLSRKPDPNAELNIASYVEQFRYDRLASRLSEVFNEVTRP